MRRRTARVGAALVSIALIASACGDDDDDAATTSAAPPSSAPSTEAPSSSTSDTPGSTPASTPASTPDSSEPGSTDFSDLETGKGVTADTIKVGISWINSDTNIDAEYGTDFGQAPGTGTQGDWAQIIVDYLNANGGIAGRQIEPVFFRYSAASLGTADTRAQSEQAMCAQFTEDNEVFAMVPVVSTEGVITQCAADTNTPMIGIGNADEGVDAGRFDEIGDVWYRPEWMTEDRALQTLVDRLLEHDFFGTDAKIGIAGLDHPAEQRAIENALLPALEAAGLEVVSQIAYPDVIASPWETYVQRFRTDGVTHVLWTGWPTPGFFMRAAEDQGYRPVYAMTSQAQVGVLPDSVGGLAPADQLIGARAIGWSTYYDFAAADYVDNEPITEADAECRAIFADHGLDPFISTAPVYCTALFFLKAALESAPALTSEGMAAGVAALGQGFVPVSSAAAAFPGGRHDGVSQVFDMVFDNEGCRCFVYEGDPVDVG